MKLTKEIKKEIDAYFESKTPEELEYIFEKYKSKRKKKVIEEVSEESWVSYKKEVPAIHAYYVTKVKGIKVEISDYWNGRHFTYNDELVTHWKRK